ncbi:MAG TPA: hypothetical protein VJN71_09120 [Nitrososphaerales archaeon]|nr:hypothetical protein [Nitrososphaerales archaeon]
MRTGSIGNRDAESLINSLVEPKKTILGDLRKELLSMGFAEEAGYDPINVESFVSYSSLGVNRFILKHKWLLVVTLVLSGSVERESIIGKLPEIAPKVFSKNEQDNTLWSDFDPRLERELILKVAKTMIEL